MQRFTVALATISRRTKQAAHVIAPSKLGSERLQGWLSVTPPGRVSARLGAILKQLEGDHMTLGVHVEKEYPHFKLHGGARPGAGRPLGSLNKISRPFREAAAMESEACLETLVRLRDHGESEQVQLAAAMAILDRAHGRPSQQIGITKYEPRTLIIDRFGHLRKPAGLPIASPERDATETEDDL